MCYFLQNKEEEEEMREVREVVYHVITYIKDRFTDG